MESFFIVGLSLLVIWLGGLTFLLLRHIQYMKALLPELDGEDNKKGLVNKFNEVLKALQEVSRREQVLQKNIRDAALTGLNSTQNVSLLRYNPYGDTGGEQSFSAIWLDGKQTGILLTSLHTRSGTRVYAKEIREGIAQIELSGEEQQLLESMLS